MNKSEITVERQLNIATQLAAECETYRHELAKIQRRLKVLVESRDEEITGIDQSNRSSLQLALHQFHTQTQNELSTLEFDNATQTESLQENHEQNLRIIISSVNDEVNVLEERRRSETWILQSILDEESHGSPVMNFDREAETYVTQKAFLDERFESIAERVREARSFLQQCHTSIESEMPAPASLKGDRQTLRDSAVELADLILTETDQISRLYLPHWIKGFRLWGFSLLAFVLIWVSVITIKADLRLFVNPEIAGPDWQWAGVAALISLSVVLIGSLLLFYKVQNSLRTRFESVQQHLSTAEYVRQLWERKSEKNIDRLEESASQWRQQIAQRRKDQTLKLKTEIDSQIQTLKTAAADKRQRLISEHEHRTQQLASTLASSRHLLKTRLTYNIQQAERRFAQELQEAQQNCVSRFENASRDLNESASQLLVAWNDKNERLRHFAQEASSLAAATRQWPRTRKGTWKLPTEMPECISVGDILVTASKAPETHDSTVQASQCVEMPAVIRFPTDTSILVEHDSAGREAALSFIRTQILKLLTIVPAGRIRLTLIDPVGLGQSFSAMMHLADFDELLIHSRIWTDSSQIRDQLQKVTEHMENIFQTYLRSQFETIEEYNVSAGEVAEPYHFVVVAGFPTAFTEESARHLSSILTSGPRCGVHALVAWNPAVAAPPSFDTDDLTNHCVRFHVRDNAVFPEQTMSAAVQFEQHPEPQAELYVQLVRDVGEQSKDARRVEVSFNRISPRPDELWTQSSADGIDLPIGRAGAARLQFMRLGRGTSQHVLIAGKTGSGKSTFLHILITNLALHYSPEEIQFYLIDFKKGVEFRSYAANRLPHARVVAIESDREFGLSVLERLDEILQERGELFRDRGVQDVPSFRERFPTETMPRLLLLIDEFQEFFVAEDRVSARASLLLDRLVRQGRAFGIHIMLGSQTLGGAYSLARSTMGQIAVRIALQCSENDAHLILSEDNVAARMLTRPGEAIYNDANGLVQGNHQFQIAWLTETQREEAIASMLSGPARSQPSDYSMIVFEGNIPPTIEHCAPLNAYLKSNADATRKTTDAITIWLGEPVAIAAPTSIELRRASGQNLLIVGQDENQIDSLLACTILSTAGRPASDISASPRLTLMHDERDPESKQRFATLKSELNITSMDIKCGADCDSTIEAIYAEVVSREENADLAGGPEHVLIVRNIGQFRSIRKEEDDFGLGGFGEAKAATSASMFSDVVKRGSLVGVHVIVWSDSFSNAMRWLSNALLREFENRIVFRMNQTDSASLIDTPVAANLGQGRAIVYRDQTGTVDKFRPFAWPSETWLQSIASSEQTAGNDFDIDSMKIE
jgi:S-DNA-T family DNA segregation ATPase FtsK/SpoIIIE